eukprot:1152295-Pelagomonas_calceolata.AAC.7
MGTVCWSLLYLQWEVLMMHVMQIVQPFLFHALRCSRLLQENSFSRCALIGGGFVPFVLTMVSRKREKQHVGDEHTPYIDEGKGGTLAPRGHWTSSWLLSSNLRGYKGKRPQSRRLTASLIKNAHEIIKEKRKCVAILVYNLNILGIHMVPGQGIRWEI